MEKNSWHEWRGKGLGSSDAPIIMNQSPWSTPFQLWQQKCNLVPKKEFSNWAIDRGNNLEPVARAKYELETGLEMPPTLAVHEKFEWLRASLDGYSKEHNIILEIKCPGAADHTKALEGKVPDKYYPQLQHQLLVTGAKAVHYYSFDGSNGVTVEVLPDQEYCQCLFQKELEFWNCIQTKTPPDLADRDTKVIRGNDDLAQEYINLVTQSKQIEEKMQEIKKRLLELDTKHPRLLIGNLQVTKSYRSGSIDYKSIPELESVDLEKYRKPGSEYVTIREVKSCL